MSFLNLPRRQFLKNSALATGALGLSSGRLLSRENNRIAVGVMGLNGRGMAHVRNLLDLPGVDVAYVCDVDERAVAKAQNYIREKTGRESAAQGVGDFRKILEDPAVDALTIATPNHWHAPAAILACQAGKHVYVEKPGSHNPHEAETLVEAARKHNRVVQLGNQRRSWSWVIEAVRRLNEGAIGKVRFARTWYNNARGSIGHGERVPVPEWLNYQLWQGPAPRRPYKDNLIHYNWHWHWHWGNGELGNNGIHALDVARWGLGVDYPKRVTCGGGRYYYNDDQQTPDVYFTTFDFGEVGASWESHSCHPRGYEGAGFGINFSGDDGSLVIAGNDCRIYDFNGKEVEQIKGQWNDRDHFANFIDCIRTGNRPHSEIGDAQKSTLLCHLGNIAYRTGHALDIDPSNGHILNDPQAQALWRRNYAEGWAV